MSAYAKAIAAGVVAAAAALAPVVDDGLLASEALWALVAFLTGAGVVGATPNRAK